MHPEKDTAEAFLLRRAAKTGVPITGSFELTPLCNLNCKMCYVRMNRTEQEKISHLQTAEEWTALAEKLRDAGTLFLLLTGGEPLLYPAFRAVYLAVRKRGMIVTLYGASGETYKSLCGDETGYAKAMRGIQLLQAHGVPVKVGVSVVRQNRHDLETLFQITKERNLELEPDTYMLPTESGQHEARLSPEEAAAASLAATKIKLGTVGFHEYAQRTVQALESAVPETEAGMRCLAGRCSFAVGWRGDLRPCVMLGALSVPIEHNDVQAAWRAVWEKSAALKQNEACVVCKLRPLCRACPASSLREGGAFGTVPPYVCAYTKALYRLLCAESTAPEILKKGETVPHAQAL